MRVVNCLPVITMTVLFVACGGGGGGGGGGGITYTGLTTGAAITDDNAADIAASAYQGGRTGAALGVPGIAQDRESKGQGKSGSSRTLELVKVLHASAAGLGDLRFGAGGVSAAASESGSFPGDCGGEVRYSINVNEGNGDISGSFDFNRFCSDGVILTGDTSVAANINLNNGQFSYLDLSFSSLTTNSGNDSFTARGTVSFDLGSYLETATLNMVMRDNGTGKVYRAENYAISMRDSGSYYSVTMSGRFYDPDYGYADLSTPVEFRFYDSDWPSSGELMVDGATGIAGGSTRAKLVALNSSYCEVYADTDGDGSLDDYYSQMLWTSL